MKFKNLRESKGFSQSQLAKKLNIDKSTIAKWEAGKSKPRLDTLIKLVMLFGSTLDEVFNCFR